MFPFRSRVRWLLASRYRHIVQGFAVHPVSDNLAREKLDALHRWDRVRAGVSVLLYLGAMASLIGLCGQLVPALSGATDAFRSLAALAGGLAGLLTVVFLLLTHLLGQIEADLVVILHKAGEESPRRK